MTEKNTKNMTALVSCFARAYHYRNNEVWVFADDYAEKLMTRQEYAAVAESMSKGINYFNPGFVGNLEEALRWIVDNQLSPSVLGRSAFCEDMLRSAAMDGCRQYLVFAAGYDTFAYRNQFGGLKVFELDLPDIIDDKISRVSNCEKQAVYVPCDLSSPLWQKALLQRGYDASGISFSSLLGISYYLTREQFDALIRGAASVVCPGSRICFDYPLSVAGEECMKNEELASAAGEKMKAKYSRKDIELILEKNGFEAADHFDEKKMTEKYFNEYNKAQPNHIMHAPEGVGYCMAVKK